MRFPPNRSFFLFPPTNKGFRKNLLRLDKDKQRNKGQCDSKKKGKIYTVGRVMWFESWKLACTHPLIAGNKKRREKKRAGGMSLWKSMTKPSWRTPSRTSRAHSEDPETMWGFYQRAKESGSTVCKRWTKINAIKYVAKTYPSNPSLSAHFYASNKKKV